MLGQFTGEQETDGSLDLSASDGRPLVVVTSFVGFIFVFSRANGEPQWPIRAKKDIYCLDLAEFMDRVSSLRDMNKDESKVKVGINYGKPLLVVVVVAYTLHS